MRRLIYLGAAFCVLSVAAPCAAQREGIRERIGERIRERAGVPAGEDFISDGVKIHYTVEGEGEPVLLIHGFKANGNMNWRAPGVTAMLAGKYKVISIDNRGHGASDKPEQEGMYGVKMVEDCIRLLDHLKIEKAHWVGYSMGGMITVKAAVMHPERVKSAVVGGWGWLQDRGPEAIRIRRPGEAEDETSAQRACFNGFAELAITKDELLAIKTPMTVVVGDEDPVYERYVKPLQADRADVSVTVIAGAGHVNCIMRPELKDAIASFIAANAGKQ